MAVFRAFLGAETAFWIEAAAGHDKRDDEWEHQLDGYERDAEEPAHVRCPAL